MPTTLPLIDPLFRFLSRRSLRSLHRIGAVAGWLTYLLSPKYRRRLNGNLAQAFDGRVPKGLLAAAVRGAGEQALELPWVWLRSQTEVLGMVKVSGWELVEEARAEGRGLLLLTPHLGCFEISSQLYASRHPITILYRPPKRAELQPLIEIGRGRPGVRLAPADVGGVRRLIKALRAKEAVGMLPDQVPGGGEGVWAPFFGRAAYSMTLAARLSEVSATEVIMVWTERLPKGAGFHMRMSRPRALIEGDTVARVAAVNREIEALIRECPAQYLWGYNRYKAPRGGSRPEQEA